MDQKLKWEEIERKDGFYIVANLFDTQPQTAVNYGLIFTARHPCEVLVISEVHGTAATGGGSGALQVEKVTSTTAKGSGSNLLGTAFDLTATANTVVFKTGQDLTTSRGLVQGDRLAIKSSGTITAIKDLQVSIYLKMLGRGDYR